MKPDLEIPFDQRRPKTLYELVNEYADSYGHADPAYMRFINYRPIEKLIPFFATTKRTKVILGANKSTKTTAGIWEDVMIYTGIVPPFLKGIYPHRIPTDRKRIVRIILQDYSKHWTETIRPMLVGPNEGILPKLWANWDDQSHMFTGPDGSMLSIMSIDPRERVEPNVLRGPGIDHTHIDEISSLPVYEESLTRAVSLHGGPSDITLTACPQDGYNWYYTEFFLPTHDPQTDKPLPAKTTHPDIFCIYGLSMDDNPSISEETKAAQKSRLKPHQLAYRYYGKFSLRGDDAYFSGEHLMDTLEKWYRDGWVDSPPHAFTVTEKVVDVDNGKFVGELVYHETFNENTQNVWFVWALPKSGRKYLITLDSGEGNPKSDFCVCDVWDATDPESMMQVAQFRKRCIKPGDFTVQALCMASVYGNPLFVPECNNTSGGAVVDRARNYEAIYQRLVEGNVEETETVRLGWFTSHIIKPAMLEDAHDTLVEMNARNGWCPFRSRVTLSEFMNYQEKVERDGNNIVKTKWGAKQGGHDDTVTAAAIAFRIVKHEFWLLTVCRLAGSEPAKEGYVSKLEQAVQKSQREIHKQPSLSALRRRALGVSRHV